MVRSHARRREKIEVVWPDRPRRDRHAFLGPRRTWHDAKHVYAIEQFPEATGRYLIYFRDQRLGEKRKLAAAKRLAALHFRRHQS